MVDQPNARQVQLTDIIEERDVQSEERSAFLDLTTGDVVAVTDEE